MSFCSCRVNRELRSLSYDCYSELIKRVLFLKAQTEMLFLFIKEYHRVISEPDEEFENLFISEEIYDWIKETCLKHRVNVLVFTYNWADYFYEILIMYHCLHSLEEDDERYWQEYLEKTVPSLIK